MNYRKKLKREAEPSKLSLTYRALNCDPDRDRVVAALNKSGKTITQIAMKSGVSRSCLSNWEKGKTRRPQHITMKFVLNAIGMDFGLVEKKFNGR